MKRTILIIVIFWSIMYPSLSDLDIISNVPKENYEIRFKIVDWILEINK